mgnify:CR=1 FL=1
MKVGFIGAGKVGCSLYDYFVHNNILVTGCYTRTQANVSGTEKQTQKIFTTSIDKILTKSDVLFLTVQMMRSAQSGNKSKLIRYKESLFVIAADH